MKISYHDTAVGLRFTNRFPELDLLRGCIVCDRIVSDLNALRTTTDYDLTEISKRIVRNANRHALQKFGRTRAEQQTTIVAELIQTIRDTPFLP